MNIYLELILIYLSFSVACLLVFIAFAEYNKRIEAKDSKYYVEEYNDDFFNRAYAKSEETKNRIHTPLDSSE